MAVKFYPSGNLDIASDPALLPAEVNQKSSVSGSMRRFTNMRTNGNGIAKTRFGSALKSSSITDALNEMIEMEGVVYEFGGDEIYADETSIAGSLTESQWSTVIHKAYNEESDNLFAINGTDRKRISAGSVSEWGATPPTDPLSTAVSVDYAVTQEWEKAQQITNAETLDECDGTTGWSLSPVRGTAAVSADTENYKDPIASITGTWPGAAAGGSYKTYYLIHDYGVGSTQDWSAYGYITFWVYRHDAYPRRSKNNYFYVENSAGLSQNIPFTMPDDATWGYIYIDASLITIAKTAIRKWGVYRTYDTTYYWNMVIKVDALQGYGYITALNALKLTATYDNSSEIAGDMKEYLYEWELEQLENNETVSSTRTYINCWWFEIAANVDAVIYIKYTLVRKEGDSIIYESNPSPAVNLTPNNAAYVSWSMPSDAQITHIRIYRTMGNPSSGSNDVYYLDSEWSASLLSGYCYMLDQNLATILETDHERPPLGSIIAGPLYGNTLFIVKGNLLYFCKPGQPEVWPEDYYIEVSGSNEPIVATAIWNGLFYCLTDREIYMIQGTTAANFTPIPCKAITGTVGIHCTTSIKGQGIYHVARDGIYCYNGVNDEQITKQRFSPLFYSETVENLIYLDKTKIDKCFLIAYKGKLYFFYPAYGETYSGNVLVVDFTGGTTRHYDYGVEFTCGCIDYTNDKLYLGDSSGYVRQIEKEDATDDNGIAIGWQIQSKVYADPLYKYFPRWAKYDCDVTSGTAYGYILLNETVKQTHELRGSRNTKKRLVTSCTGDRLSIRLAGSGVVTYYSAEVE